MPLLNQIYSGCSSREAEVDMKQFNQKQIFFDETPPRSDEWKTKQKYTIFSQPITTWSRRVPSRNMEEKANGQDAPTIKLTYIRGCSLSLANFMAGKASALDSVCMPTTLLVTEHVTAIMSDLHQENGGTRSG